MPTSGYAYRFIERWFGGAMKIVPSSAAMSSTAAPIVRSNPDRVALVLTNLGTSAVFLTTDNDSAPSSTHGILLGSNGGTISMMLDQDGPMPAYGWQGVAASGTPSISVIEVIGQP